jgi:hypothetical protein
MLICIIDLLIHSRPAPSWNLTHDTSASCYFRSISCMLALPYVNLAWRHVSELDFAFHAHVGLVSSVHHTAWLHTHPLNKIDLRRHATQRKVIGLLPKNSIIVPRLCARGGVDVEPSPTATREGNDVETCCIHCFSTKTFCKVSACIGLGFLVLATRPAIRRLG